MSNPASLLESIAPLLVIQAYVAAMGAFLYYLSARRDSRALRRHINTYGYARRDTRGRVEE